MNRSSKTLRRLTLVLIAAYLVALALIVFWPTPVDRPAAGTLDHFIAWTHRHGVPTAIGYAQIEFSANIALFVPLGIIAAAWTQKAWVGLLVGFAASVFIELGQLLFLPARYASVLDVVANTLGAGLGVVIFHFAHTHCRSKPGHVSMDKLLETRPTETGSRK